MKRNRSKAKIERMMPMVHPNAAAIDIGATMHMAAVRADRTRIGLGAFFCALGVIHFLETYLASIFYVALPFCTVTSPGSTVLFTGKLMMLLLLYIREDAKVVRQPIGGSLFGNVLLFALAFVMRHHTLVPLLHQRVGRADGVGHRDPVLRSHGHHPAL